MASVPRPQMLAMLIQVLLVFSLALFHTGAVATTNCTDISFRTPAWAVDNVHYSSRVRIGPFRLTNIANNYSTTMSCESGRCTPHISGNEDEPWVQPCGLLNMRNSNTSYSMHPLHSPLVTFTNTCASHDIVYSLQLRSRLYRDLNGGSLVIILSQTWTCDDKRWNDVPASLIFTANATATIPAECDENGACVAVKRLTLVRASLTTPMAGTQRYLDPVAGKSAPNCRSPPLGTWEVSNVMWYDRQRFCLNPPGPSTISCIPNGVGGGLELFNRVLNTTTRCYGMMSYQLVPNSEMQPFRCEGNIAGREYYTETNVILLRTDNDSLSMGTAQVNQTWHCDDDGPDRPFKVTTRSASISIPLACTYESGTIDFWGTTYAWHETTCKGNSSASLALESVSAASLPPYALEEPNHNAAGAYTGMCLLRHLRTTSWTIEMMSTLLNYTNGSPRTAQVGFFANNRDLNAGGYCPNDNRAPVPLIPGTNDTDGSPCRFKFDSKTGLFTLRRYTQCNDIDRAHPYLFTATASFTVPPLDCTWNDYYPESEKPFIIRCRWQADPRVNEFMNITSLSDIVWEPMPPTGFSPNLWDGRSASAFPWLEPAK
ncbi:hypothetical protein V8F06_013366 [Rhypophila decipiens]